MEHKIESDLEEMLGKEVPRLVNPLNGPQVRVKSLDSSGADVLGFTWKVEKNRPRK